VAYLSDPVALGRKRELARRSIIALHNDIAIADILLHSYVGHKCD
jgi:hypothetical protein